MGRLIATALLALLSMVRMVGAEPVPLPGIEIVTEGCSPCHAGDHIHLTLRVWRPGVSIGEAEVRASIRTPAGAVVRLPVSGTVLALPAGLSAITILDATVSGAPGVYLIEGAILNPVTGVTMDRTMRAIITQ